MKEYKVQWFGAEIESSITKTIKAENERDAIDKAVEKYKVWSSYRAHPMLRIISDERGGDHKQFDNPNFDPNYKKENRAEQSREQSNPQDRTVFTPLINTSLKALNGMKVLVPPKVQVGLHCIEPVVA